MSARLVISDHGLLMGLGDDDHPQYLNSARHLAIGSNPHGVSLQEAYADSPAPNQIAINSTQFIGISLLNNTSEPQLRLTATPVATPNIPYAAIEFYGAIDIVTNTFNSGLIKSGFAAGTGFDKGYLTLCSPQTIGVWNEVLTVRNSRVGLGVTNPLCSFHTDALPQVINWSDNNNRNTAEYHTFTITSANLGTGLSGLFGVDTVWTGGNPSGRNVNATFFSFDVELESAAGGQHHTGMVCQLTLQPIGFLYANSGVAMQGKILLGQGLGTNITNTGIGQVAVEAFMQGQVTGTYTVAKLTGFKTRPWISGTNLTLTDLFHMQFDNAIGSGTVVNQYGLWIPNLTGGTTVNQAIILAGDGAGSDIFFGAAQDASIYYDGTDLILDPAVVGTGAVNIPGDLIFTGDGTGLQFAEMYVENNAVATTITVAGTWVQVLVFGNNGQSNGATPDNTQDHITINHAGRYLITVSASVLSGAGAGGIYECEVRTNNGVTAMPNIHWDRQLAGGGGDVGSTSMSGVADLAATDTVEVWVRNKTTTTDIIFEDINLTVVEIGGT